MKQETILQLLQEAAKPDCSWDRRHAIGKELAHASAGAVNGKFIYDKPETGAYSAMNMVFFDTLKNRPELLPSLFPIFAVVCGERKEGFFINGSINWALMPELTEQ